MVGTDDISIMGDWAPANPSPMILTSSFLPDYRVKNESPLPKMEVVSKVEKVEPGFDFSNQSKMFGDQKPTSSHVGGLGGRRAANGFNLPTINTKLTGLPSMSSPSSDLLTIPPGFSPTSLLDSPVFLSNPLMLPSPTTGKFLFNSSGNPSSFPVKNVPNSEDEIFKGVPEAFAFNHLDPNPSFFSPYERKIALSFDQQHPFPSIKQDCEADQKGSSAATIGTLAEDGYNWRKYGQKQVKGSEYPRSYYKCTHLNCEVKKKVERSQEGHITEIIYKGTHNHPKPPPNRRSGVLSSHPFNDQQNDGAAQTGSQSSFDGKFIWASTQNNGGQDWRNDRLEATSPSLITDVSSTMSNDEEDDDRATRGSVSAGCDGDGDDTETKRRKLEACAIEMGAASRAVREPRVVVRTISEVDILDDGYRWRKYGQKVVKGNPNPRSYYKCTNPGCTVRKHVERASHDLKSVITTYEGKHNHDVPAARNSNHPNTASNTSATSAPQTHSLMRTTEPTQDGVESFENHAALGAYMFAGREQLGLPNGFSFAMGQMGRPGLTNLVMAGLGPMVPMKVPVLAPVHAYQGGRHLPPDGGFMVPKGEPEEEMLPGSRLPMPNGGSIYHQMISRMPLGPQL